ncbi:putative low-affinity inorganic phosphate transporter [Thioalkalivibrio nitratireducens DSM 14787]|uniref:Phosphate transporter n=1 Tax=Thioalkalivibrio nitratireducens (strain DSM 14787 / UNIQEM 213 / ALEN2) TaxID=1255043 RepID=L0DZ69_THIND|nr:inorganic phosphate transporter [Thioalkalivibrio nitratireducens]AGA33676.1 putative low-affinity inorganic phosphate transporter [Thioalkalivibrio nitratireducens DSM 14787]
MAFRIGNPLGDRKASLVWSPENLRLAAGMVFMIGVFAYALLLTRGIPTLTPQGLLLLVASAVVGAYMAMNIGANDVANNLGPAVGSRAITLGWAIVIAAVFEALGAIIAGGEVVGTIKGGIIDPAEIEQVSEFAWLMFSALLAGALWLNLATALGAPVSTTHSIIGAVMGAGIAAGGWALVNWATIGQIVASWLISPLMGGLIAATILYVIKRKITYRSAMHQAAGQVVPWLVALMAWAFATFMLIKGLGDLYRLPVVQAAPVGAVVALAAFLAVRGPIRRSAATLENTKGAVNRLFTVPLIFAAALLSFAHGANDVANAIGPLAAIYEAIKTDEIATRAATPMWILILGAVGLAAGLALYGSKLIRTVGREITELDRMRAFSIALAAAITVIIAAQLGMPISTTHVTIGALFGVGFLREYLKTNYAKMEQTIIAGHEGEERAKVEAYLHRFEAAPIEEKRRMLADIKARSPGIPEAPLFAKKERKAMKKVVKQQLVKRSLVFRIVAAWIITVPATAVLAALLFKLIILLGG